jgi:hypothetical protein
MRISVAAFGGIAMFVSACVSVAQATTYQVGPTRALKTPSQAAAIVQDGDVVAIDAGIYVGDVAAWHKNNLILRGVGTGRAVLLANGQSSGGKGIWVISGSNVLVENIEFANAVVPDQNGAGIRHESGSLRVLNCLFRNNEMGILQNNVATATLSVERSEFANNGRSQGGGLGHALYAGISSQLRVTGSYFHGTPRGHLVKTRAKTNYILFNRIVDGPTGASSYNIDVANGGLTYIVGNEIKQGKLGENFTVVMHNSEGLRYSDNRLFAVDNTFANDETGHGTFIYNRSGVAARVVNNILLGSGTVLNGPGTLTNNLLGLYAGGTPTVAVLNGNGNSGNQITATPMLVDPANDNYKLQPGSPAIGMGVDPASVLGTAVQVTLEYRLPFGTRRAGWARRSTQVPTPFPSLARAIVEPTTVRS